MLKTWQNQEAFISRHIGPNSDETKTMLQDLGFNSLESLVEKIIPKKILAKTPFVLPHAMDEHAAMKMLREAVTQNEMRKSCIGLGYYDTHTPPVLLRNVFHNPGWYTAYTPYQAEISQGRLEVLLNFQQMVMDLTGFDLANASLLDEATAAAEAMAMAKRITGCERNSFFVDENVLPQTLEVIKTRAYYFGFNVVMGRAEDVLKNDYFGAVFQYPNVEGRIEDFTPLFVELKAKNTIVICATDLLALTILKSPKELGADIVLGSSQRFGVPMGFGGPHAAFFATKDEYKRMMPGRIIGVSKDTRGRFALRMALQTREQHIRREKANSNICTSQVLLANMAALYAMYHGAEGLKKIAHRVHYYANVLKHALKLEGFIFDTLALSKTPQSREYNFGHFKGKTLVNISETIEVDDIEQLYALFTGKHKDFNELQKAYPETAYLKEYASYLRTDVILTHPHFNDYQTETKMMRYLKKLENRDLSLTQSMIPLGSCTMKLNAAAEMLPVSWPLIAQIHPFAPEGQVRGYQWMIQDLIDKLKMLTGFDAISMQPNSGAQGEYAGLLAIRRYQASIGQSHRNICLIPRSAHGTNPATAQMMGMQVVVVNCDDKGNVEVADLEAKAKEHAESLAALMITYPSTHGVYEGAICDITKIVHDHGGQVYMDGANFNALVGFVKPAELGADVMHMNLHKTFAIPHGGGGPGMGPIGVAKHLEAFLPGKEWAVAAAPCGSASILVISWMYITMLGNQGLKIATEYALLNANYIAKKLDSYFPVLYKGESGFIAHECIFDLRPLKAETGISEVDIAKRLMDYGFHAPTMSFPVAGTLMVEPTESEDKGELDRFIEAMISIHGEIQKVKSGQWDKLNNPLKHAPHTEMDVRDWNKPYSIEIGCYPSKHTKVQKYWPSVNRIDDVFGDRQLVCSCPSIDE